MFISVMGIFKEVPKIVAIGFRIKLSGNCMTTKIFIFKNVSKKQNAIKSNRNGCVEIFGGNYKKLISIFILTSR